MLLIQTNVLRQTVPSRSVSIINDGFDGKKMNMKINNVYSIQYPDHK